eukprot:scaffold69579_cov70-Phaeocystis_antarctica.AAC.5
MVMRYGACASSQVQCAPSLYRGKKVRMLGFVRSAWRLCCAFACLVSLPADGPARLRIFGDGGGCVVRVASHTSQLGSSVLLRKVHAAHAHCTPSAPTPSALTPTAGLSRLAEPAALISSSPRSRGPALASSLTAAPAAVLALIPTQASAPLPAAAATTARGCSCRQSVDAGAGVGAGTGAGVSAGVGAAVVTAAESSAKLRTVMLMRRPCCSLSSLLRACMTSCLCVVWQAPPMTMRSPSPSITSAF